MSDADSVTSRNVPGSTFGMGVLMPYFRALARRQDVRLSEGLEHMLARA